MIHYHGAPIWPQTAAVQFFPRRHAFVSFEHAAQMPLVAELCQSFAIDCGSFSKWKAALNAAKERIGSPYVDTAGTDEWNRAHEEARRSALVDVEAYAAFVRQWDQHPGFDFAIVPDVIDGEEIDNVKMEGAWLNAGMRHGVVVWHLHESLERLRWLVHVASVNRGRIAIGSSGRWSTPGTPDWWARMDEARDVICDEDGRPKCKLHGLRMLNPTVFSHIPLSSADSCNVALNIGKDTKWSGTYQPVTEAQRAQILAERIELHAAARTWSKRSGVQQNLELIG